MTAPLKDSKQTVLDLRFQLAQCVGALRAISWSPRSFRVKGVEELADESERLLKKVR